ncbi:MAG: hypothetical protein IPG01_13950 [Chitinophagaceae bacterium]|nr:hypothetical protein [Chitinophagaceae bacterium]
MKNLSALLLLLLPQLLSAQLPYQHKLFDSQVNYTSILAQMEVLLQSSTGSQENWLPANYYRWKYFWDNRVSYKTGVANSFYPSHFMHIIDFIFFSAKC